MVARWISTKEFQHYPCALVSNKLISHTEPKILVQCSLILLVPCLSPIVLPCHLTSKNPSVHHISQYRVQPPYCLWELLGTHRCIHFDNLNPYWEEVRAPASFSSPKRLLYFYINLWRVLSSTSQQHPRPKCHDIWGRGDDFYPSPSVIPNDTEQDPMVLASLPPPCPLPAICLWKTLVKEYI